MERWLNSWKYWVLWQDQCLITSTHLTVCNSPIPEEPMPSWPLWTQGTQMTHRYIFRKHPTHIKSLKDGYDLEGSWYNFMSCPISSILNPQLREENNVKSWGQKHSENNHCYSVSGSSYPPLSFYLPARLPSFSYWKYSTNCYSYKIRSTILQLFL